MNVIIYKDADGSICVCNPNHSLAAVVGYDAIAQKDVPAGCKYKIVDESEILADRSLQHLWRVPDESLDDGVGAQSSEFPPDILALVTGRSADGPGGQQ